MAEYEYQVVEQGGGRISHVNDRLTTLTADGWEPFMMSGTAPHVAIMLRRPAGQASPQPPARGASPAQQ